MIVVTAGASGDRSHMRIRSLGAVLLLVATTARGQSAGARSHVIATFGDSTFWPEGIDADQSTGKLYVASVMHRTIAEVSANGAVRELLSRDRNDFGPIFGVRVDSKRGVVWASSSGYAAIPGSDTAPAALLEIRIADGEVLRRFIVPAMPKGHVLGDLAIGPSGDVYVSDSVQPLLYVLRVGSDRLESITSPLFKSLQGIAPTPDGRFVYLTDYSSGLLRLSTETRAVDKLADAAGSTARGCDGIVWYDHSIVAVQNGTRTKRIIRFVLSEDGAAIDHAQVLDENPEADEPTIITVRGDELVFVGNSQWDKHGDHGERVAGTTLTAPKLFAVKMP